MEVQIQYIGMVYVHHNEGEGIIQQLKKEARKELITITVTNGTIVICEFDSESLREKWENTILQMSPISKNFFSARIKISGENRRSLSAQAKKELDRYKGHFIAEKEEKETLFLTSSFENQDLRRVWEGTIVAFKS